jgi:hypothetical protein
MESMVKQPNQQKRSTLRTMVLKWLIWIAVAFVGVQFLAVVLFGMALAGCLAVEPALVALVSFPAWLWWVKRRFARQPRPEDPEQERHARTALRTAPVFYTACTWLVASFVMFAFQGGPPSKNELAEMFKAHGGQYARLKEMMFEDQLETVADFGHDYARKRYHYTTSRELGISDERAQEYSSLMKAANTRRIDADSTNFFQAFVGGSGFAGKGWRAGICWSDDFHRPAASQQSSGFVMLDNSWYGASWR